MRLPHQTVGVQLSVLAAHMAEARVNPSAVAFRRAGPGGLGGIGFAPPILGIDWCVAACSLACSAACNPVIVTGYKNWKECIESCMNDCTVEC